MPTMMVKGLKLSVSTMSGTISIFGNQEGRVLMLCRKIVVLLRRSFGAPFVVMDPP